MPLVYARKIRGSRLVTIPVPPLYVHKRYCLHCLTVCRQSIKNARAQISDLRFKRTTLITSTTLLNNSTGFRLIEALCSFIEQSNLDASLRASHCLVLAYKNQK